MAEVGFSGRSMGRQICQGAEVKTSSEAGSSSCSFYHQFNLKHGIKRWRKQRDRVPTSSEDETSGAFLSSREARAQIEKNLLMLPEIGKGEHICRL
ncbi:hypothetical protein KSP40_PGU020289 [Platanthera guangdongensis]|uniref:Uncharacterized protein n=1 Tax=Platanthera guangdongensis TaxID=2320717 RepID=A0ABR2LG44_9ASPA